MKKNNIITFLRKYHPDFRIVSGGKEALLPCIFHGGEKRKLYISLETGKFICFKCEAKGTFKSFIQKTKQVLGLDKLDFKIDSSLVEESEPLGPPPKVEYPEGFFFFDGKEGTEGKKALDYLYKRGIAENEIYFYKLGYCIFGKYANRILVPVFEDKELVSFVARDYTGFSTIKVLTPPGYGTVGIKQYLFNFDSASLFSEIILTEGVFDAISAGIRAVALFGKTPTEIQFNKIVKAKKDVVVCLDADAQKEAQKLALRLSLHGLRARLARMPEGYDPNSIPKEDLLKVINNAEELSGWGSPI